MTDALAAPVRPYEAREFNHRELQRKDIYSYFSPKEDRLVRVSGPLNLAFALLLEFKPEVRGFIERPRTLACGTDAYEVDFWYVDAANRERMTMTVPAKSSVAAEGGRRRHRRALQLVEAAEAAHLPLEFEQEAQLLEQTHAVQNAFRLLPSVQLAHRLPNRAVFREQVLTLLTQFECLRIEHVEANLDRFPRPDIRCVVADLLHSGDIVLVDSGPIRIMSRIKRSTP
jgi:hypothetical protein